LAEQRRKGVKRWLIIFSAVLSAMLAAGFVGYTHYRKVAKWESRAHEKCRELSKADRDLLSGTDLAFVVRKGAVWLAESHLEQIPFMADSSALVEAIKSSEEMNTFMKGRLIEEAAAKKEEAAAKEEEAAALRKSEQALEMARLRDEALAWEKPAHYYLLQLRSDHPRYRMDDWIEIASKHLKNRPDAADEELFQQLKEAVFNSL
jgi:hypothetical protein